MKRIPVAIICIVSCCLFIIIGCADTEAIIETPTPEATPLATPEPTPTPEPAPEPTPEPTPETTPVDTTLPKSDFSPSYTSEGAHNWPQEPGKDDDKNNFNQGMYYLKSNDSRTMIINPWGVGNGIIYLPSIYVSL